MKTIRKDEKRYYEDLLQYSQEHLMLYPYHLSDVIVKGLRVTPFTYYTNMMSDIMSQEKSYDSLPNFTAADCEYIMSLEARKPVFWVSHQVRQIPACTVTEEGWIIECSETFRRNKIIVSVSMQ